MILLLIFIAIASGIAATKHGLLLSRVPDLLQDPDTTPAGGGVLVVSRVLTTLYKAFKAVQSPYPYINTV